MGDEKPLLLVTGGRGLLAMQVIGQALQQGYRVRTTLQDLAQADDLRGELALQHLPSHILDIHQAQLGREDGWYAAMQGVNYLIDLASDIPPASLGAKDMAREIDSRTGIVMRAAGQAGVKRVIKLSTAMAAYAGKIGAPSVELDENAWTDPFTFGLSSAVRAKIFEERSAWAWAGASAIELVSLLPTSLWGPTLSSRHKNRNQPISQIFRKERIGIHHQYYRPIDIRDMGQLILEATESPEVAGKRFLVAGTQVSQAKLTGLIKQLYPKRKGLPSLKLPGWLEKTAQKLDPAEYGIEFSANQPTKIGNRRLNQYFQTSLRPLKETVKDVCEMLLHPDQTVTNNPSVTSGRLDTPL